MFLYISGKGFNIITNNIILDTILWLLVNLYYPFAVTIIAFIVYYFLVSLILVFYFSFKDKYVFTLERSVKYTESTLDTIHKIYSLGAFLKDFSNFSKKSIEEIHIWERYFSYAYLFGLNKKLSLCDTKICKNSLFILDDNIDSIDEIEITKN